MILKSTVAFAALIALVSAWTPIDPGVRISGHVVEAINRVPIEDAIVTIGDRTSRTNAQGFFVVDSIESDNVLVRAPGYARARIALHGLRQPEPEIALQVFHPKALYLSVYGIGDKRLRTAALTLLDTTELNALVIDMKGDRGIVPYPSAIELASQVGAQKVITISDLSALITSLRERGVYTIARIVVFKDNLLARGRPNLALHRLDGSIFQDREGLAWTNPHNKDVWSYNIGIAVEAAKAGFDEIQFDYVRLPDATGLAYDVPWTEGNREAAIDGFLSQARTTLTPFNVFLAADIFGYVCWNPDDTKIGQQLEHLAGIVDYLSPMLYPSSFQFGIPGYRNPVQQPYQVVHLSLEQAGTRTNLPAIRFRPWLQAFRDYAFDRRSFGASEVRIQVNAAEDFGANGWMLWNPHNEYPAAAFKAR